jgi:hypothetical protein
MSACDPLNTSRYSLTALFGGCSVIIGRGFLPITKKATEPVVVGEVCGHYVFLASSRFRECLFRRCYVTRRPTRCAFSWKFGY